MKHTSRTMILVANLHMKCTWQCSRFPAPISRWRWIDSNWDLIQWNVNFRVRLRKWLIGCYTRLIFHSKMLWNCHTGNDRSHTLTN
jgi:hypothetical protein